MDYTELELHAVALSNGDTRSIDRIAELLFNVAERARKMEEVCRALDGSQGNWNDAWLNELAQKASDAIKNN